MVPWPSSAAATPLAEEVVNDVGMQRQVVLSLMQSGDSELARAARTALLGTDVDFQKFFTEELTGLEERNSRVEVLRLLESGGPAVRAAAKQALDAGTHLDRENFIYFGFDSAWVQDERSRALQVKEGGAFAVQQAAKQALDGGDAAITKFLLEGQFVARAHDERAQALAIMSGGGAATREMAKAALDAGPDAIHEFVTTGAEISRARDKTLESVTELAEQAQAALKKAEQDTEAAKEASAKAVTAANNAKAAAELAAKETLEAKDSAKKAAAAAGRAADAAAAAARAAEDAIDAAAEAYSAATAAADAAAKAAAAAVMASNAAATANGEAVKAIIDEGNVKGARDAANQALGIAIAAEHASMAAEQASLVAKNSASAALSVASAAAHADAAAAAADDARANSGLAGAEADRARNNAARARAAAARATKSAQKAVALANRAADEAAESGRMAADAAKHARAAAAAANKAADEAGQAADRAAQSRTHAANAIASANAATKAAGQAADVANLATQAENDRIQLLQEEGVARAAVDLKVDRAIRASAAWDAQAKDRQNAETKALIAAARAPGATSELLLGQGRQAAMDLITVGGSYTKAAAEEALTGGEDDLRYFFTTGLEAAEEQDDRARVAHIAETADVAGLKAAAETALTGSIEDVRQFMRDRSYPGKGNDDRAAILRTMSLGSASHAAGSTALDGTDADRNEYLARGQYAAAEHDERAKILSILSANPAPGPEVQAAGKIALAGPEPYMRGFLTAGHAAALERDQLLLTHQHRVAVKVAEAAKAAGLANEAAFKAAEYAETANKAEAKAAEYRAQAIASANEAAGYATKAADSAAAAQRSAAEAAASSARANQAAAAARADAQKADQSAADARYSAYLADQHADEAAEYAADARASAEAAQKTRLEIEQAYEDAYAFAIAKINEEEEARRNNPDSEGKKCNRPPGLADPSCYPDLPGMPRNADSGETVCWSYAVEEGNTRCGYYVVTDEQRRILEQEWEYMQSLNMCMLWGQCALAYLMLNVTLDSDAMMNDPDMMGDTSAEVASQKRLDMLMRQLREAMERSCVRENSFDADTLVLMGDGTAKPISDVQVHDFVLATDPVTGRTGSREVTDLHLNQDSDLADIQVRGPDGLIDTVNTTQEHPFWSVGDRSWTHAENLDAGDRLSVAGSGEATVVHTRSFTGQQPMYNLSVDDLNSYYVFVGVNAVLVHNDPPGPDLCDLEAMEQALSHLPWEPHTLKKHVNVSPSRATELAQGSDGGTNGVWANKATAQTVVNTHLRRKGIMDQIKKMPFGENRTFKGKINNQELGWVAKSDGTFIREKVYCYSVVIRKDKSIKAKEKWYVFTSYPRTCTKDE
ncbi:polymorphic toxin-type HINT domain-containing protein [Actinoplanes subglobosus]|uniref:Polymorphic toxin-type HINT domain-containing protein n=1 Tax=Actinoplanes subglobosus TaxID=1547892 RepID=A0ABV8IRF0_9ACTN